MSDSDGDGDDDGFPVQSKGTRRKGHRSRGSSSNSTTTSSGITTTTTTINSSNNSGSKKSVTIGPAPYWFRDQYWPTRTQLPAHVALPPSETQRILAGLTKIEESPRALPFLLPVDTAIFPSYRQVVREPMHLALIRYMLEQSRYGSKAEIMADFDLLHRNCLAFCATP